MSAAISNSRACTSPAAVKPFWHALFASSFDPQRNSRAAGFGRVRCCLAPQKEEIG